MLHALRGETFAGRKFSDFREFSTKSLNNFVKIRENLSNAKEASKVSLMKILPLEENIRES